MARWVAIVCLHAHCVAFSNFPLSTHGYEGNPGVATVRLIVSFKLQSKLKTINSLRHFEERDRERMDKNVRPSMRSEEGSIRPSLVELSLIFNAI